MKPSAQPAMGDVFANSPNHSDANHGWAWIGGYYPGIAVKRTAETIGLDHAVGLIAREVRRTAAKERASRLAKAAAVAGSGTVDVAMSWKRLPSWAKE
jgi:hypothetical protein